MLRLLVPTLLSLMPATVAAGGGFDSLFTTQFVVNCASGHEEGLSDRSLSQCACALDVLRHRGYTQRSVQYLLTGSRDATDQETLGIIERRCVQAVPKGLTR